MKDVLLYKDIYRKFTKEAYHIDVGVISNSEITSFFGRTPKAGDYIAIVEYPAIEIAEVKSFKNGVITIDETIVDMEFSGYLLLIRPTSDFKQLSNLIAEYKVKNPNDGLQSESIPNYSYAKSAKGLEGWQGVFEKELNRYIPMSIDIGKWLGGLTDGN